MTKIMKMMHKRRKMAGLCQKKYSNRKIVKKIEYGNKKDREQE